MQTLKVAFAIFLLMAFLHKAAFAEEVVSPDDFAFINQYKNDEISDNSRQGVLLRTISLFINEAANMGIIYYGCVALNSLAAHSPLASASPQIDESGQPKLGKNDLCLVLVSVIAPNEAAIVSSSSPWPTVYPWHQTAQVFGAIASAYHMYQLQGSQEQGGALASLNMLQNKPIAMLSGVLGFFAMSSLSSTFAALGAALAEVKKSDFEPEEIRRRYVSSYKGFHLAPACGVVGIVADFALSKSGHSDSEAAVLSVLLAGLTGMLGSFLVSDETSGNYDLGAGPWALIGITMGVLATVHYPETGLGATRYVSLANAAGAVAGAYVSGKSFFAPLLLGVFSRMIALSIQKHTSLQKAGARGLIAQTAASFGLAVFINSLANYYTQGRPVENTLTDTNKWIWKKFYSPGEYLKHILNLD